MILAENKFRELSRGFSDRETAVNNADIILLLLVFIVVIIAIILIYHFYYKKKSGYRIFKDNNISKKNYTSLARSVDLNIEESKALLELIIKFKLRYPLTCFTNSKILDDVLRRGLHGIEDNKNLSNQNKNDRSFVLLEIKRKIDSSLRKSIGIKSTHFISEGQKIVVFARGKGYFYANVTKNTKSFLMIEIISKKVQKRLFLTNDYLKLYLWRDEDAGYTFESEIIGYGNNVRVYLIKHSENLARSQKRKYRRIPVNILVDIYPIDIIPKEDTKHYSVGTKAEKGNIINISSGGVKLRTDGLEGHEKFIKLLFPINRYNISVIGKIVRLYQLEDVKELTVQFVKISIKDTNIINKYVYKYLPGY